MECRDFQKLIPKIIDDDIPEEDLEKVLEHVKSCKYCYDEMEIYYVLKYGFGEDDNNDNMNFIGLLDEKITGLEKKCHYYEMASSLYEAVYIISNTAVFGTLIYILFKIF